MKFLIAIAVVALGAYAGSSFAEQTQSASIQYAPCSTYLKLEATTSHPDGSGKALISVNGHTAKTVSTGNQIAPGLVLYRVFKHKIVVHERHVVDIYYMAGRNRFVNPKAASAHTGQVQKTAMHINVSAMQSASVLQYSNNHPAPM